MRLKNGQTSLSQGSAKFRFLFLALIFVRFFCRRLFAKFFDLRSWLSVSFPLRSVGTPCQRKLTRIVIRQSAFIISVFGHFELHVFDIVLAIVWSIVLWFETTKCHRKYLLQKPVRRVSPKYVFSLVWYLKVVGIKVHGHCHCECEISEIGKHYSSPVSLQNHYCI